MKKFFSAGLMAMLLLAILPQSMAQETVSGGKRAEVTVITSDKLTFDYEQRYALFEGNVVATDPQVKLTADTLTVTFDADNQISELVASGKRVLIIQDDMNAESGKAIYDMKKGEFILTEKPRVWRGRDVLTGDKIIYMRDQNRLIVEPRARLIIYPEEGKRDIRLGE